MLRMLYFIIGPGRAWPRDRAHARYHRGVRGPDKRVFATAQPGPACRVGARGLRQLPTAFSYISVARSHIHVQVRPHTAPLLISAVSRAR